MFKPEQIEAALFELLKAAAGPLKFRKVGRHAMIWSNLTEADLPALQLVPDGYLAVQEQQFGLPKYDFQYFVIVYAIADADPNSIPQQILNAAAESIQAVFATRPPGEKQTLGGLVENCWVDGMVNYAPGELVQQLACVLPIRGITGI